jgi:DNA-binding CsgD family transcriptional regulator
LLREPGALAEAIAAHLGAVRPAGSIDVAAALVRAADQALGRAAPDAAIRWLRRALEEGAPEPSRAAILAELGFAEVAARDMAAVGHLQAALELAEDPRLRARITVALGEILSHAGRWEEGRAVLAAAVTEFGDADPEVALEVMAYWTVIALFDPRLVEDFERERERLNRLAAVGDGWAAHALCAVIAMAAAIRGDAVDEVVPWAERALAGGRLFAERGAGGWASSQVLSALVTIDEHDRALVACEKLAERARACGSLIGSTTALVMRGWVLARRGALTDAEAQFRTVYEMFAQAGMAMMVTSFFYFLQDAVLERQSLDDFAALVEAIELEPAFLDSGGGAMLLEPRGRLRLLRGDRDRAIEDLRACATTYAALRFGPAVSSWRSGLALALPAEARAEACDLVAEEVDLARATGLARPCGVALRAAGILEGGEGGIERLAESVSVLERSEARLEHARSLVELGAAVRRRGRRAEARAPLTTGMDLAHRCGAERLVDRAREELYAAGARPRRIASTGTNALTASERRVTRLAAEGRTNAEIAQELYVSLKTVDTHLSHAYAKLGISGQGARKRLTATIGSDTESAP